MYGNLNYYYCILKMDNNAYDFIKEGGWNTGVIQKDNQVAGFSLLISRSEFYLFIMLIKKLIFGQVIIAVLLLVLFFARISFSIAPFLFSRASPWSGRHT